MSHNGHNNTEKTPRIFKDSKLREKREGRKEGREKVSREEGQIMRREGRKLNLSSIYLIFL